MMYVSHIKLAAVQHSVLINIVCAFIRVCCRPLRWASK